jgi:hypothetical protein
MELEDLKKDLVNVSLNYKFFEFHTSGILIKKYLFVLKDIRSFNKTDARQLYKPITRSVSLNNFKYEESKSR